MNLGKMEVEQEFPFLGTSTFNLTCLIVSFYLPSGSKYDYKTHQRHRASFIDGALIFRRKVGVSFYDYLNGKILSGHTANFSKTKRKVSRIDNFFFTKVLNFVLLYYFLQTFFELNATCFLHIDYNHRQTITMITV